MILKRIVVLTLALHFPFKAVMKRKLLTILYPLISLSCLAQGHGFPFGQITTADLEMTTYARDTTASAVALNEFGEAYFDFSSGKLMFEYHVKIKILKTQGLDQGNFSIRLYKSGDKMESLRSVKGSTFNNKNGEIIESKFDDRNVFTTNVNKNYDEKKFTLPNVQVGSIIEVQLKTELPFIYYFQPWSFQSSIPKVYSEYWAKIPGNFVYNMRLKGFLKLTKNESSIISECFKSGSSYGTGYGADCVLYKYAMKNIPAFVEEENMTSRKNFVAAIVFELSEIKYFDGRVDKLTKEWKDAEEELRKDNRFGAQLKKGKDLGIKFDEAAQPAEQARRIFHEVKTWYTWNGEYEFLCESGIKKAYQSKKGSIADINLSLIAAIRTAGLDVEPVLLSTRDNGLPTEVHPVLGDFNYVIAKVNVDGQAYLLDASDPDLPFGMLPKRCLNGKGRVFGEKGSYWYDLKPSDKDKNVIVLDLALEPSGIVSGTIHIAFHGYQSVEQRKKILSFNNSDEYIQDLNKKMSEAIIKNHEITGVDDVEGPITVRLEVEMENAENMNVDDLFVDPFLAGKLVEANPFRSTERLYPVDFGVPVDFTGVVNFTYPKEFELVSRPDRIAISLPNSGGKFVFDIIGTGDNKLTVTYSLLVNKTVYQSNEYPFLKELYSRVIQAQNADLIFKKKSN